MPHNELLVKLSHNGIKGNLWNWFNNYLHNRSQCVKICSISDFLPVLSGVPQGSILGPLLFLIYINDILSQSHNSRIFSCLLMMPNSTKIIFQLSDYLHLQQDLNQLHTWTSDGDLLLSINKCVHLSFNNKTPTSYSVDEHSLPQLHSHHDLGLLLTDDLSWRNHYEHLASKAYKYLGLLRRAFSCCHSMRAKCILYTTLVRSQLSYCSQLWNPYLIKDTVMLERIQRQATKFILRDYDSDYN